jgi:hypothetical protein
MMKTRKCILISPLLLIGMSMLLAGDVAADLRGTSGFSFLKIEPDARSAGMAGAVVSVIDDAFSVWWNPAGLGSVGKTSAGVSHIFWFADINYDQVSAAARLPKVGTFALSFGTLYMTDPIPGLDTSGNPLNRSVDVNAWTAGLSWGAKISSFKRQTGDTAFYVGATAKLVSETFFDTTLRLAACDIGIKGESLLLDGVNLGLVLYNIGPSFSLGSSGAAEVLPFSYSIGVSYAYVTVLSKNIEWGIVPAVDISFMNDYPTMARIGIESSFTDMIRKFTVDLRLGYVTPQDNGMLAGFRAGVGFEFKEFTLDYSISPYGDIDTVHRLTFNIAVP